MKSVSIRDTAQKEAAAGFRSAPQQIELWAMIGRNALANPDLPVDYIMKSAVKIKTSVREKANRGCRIKRFLTLATAPVC